MDSGETRVPVATRMVKGAGETTDAESRWFPAAGVESTGAKPIRKNRFATSGEGRTIATGKQQVFSLLPGFYRRWFSAALVAAGRQWSWRHQSAVFSWTFEEGASEERGGAVCGAGVSGADSAGAGVEAGCASI